jgi:UDP-N-acetylmuramate dehydrogenase
MVLPLRVEGRETVMANLAEFGGIVKRGEKLAPYTYLRLGGPAEYLIEPRSREELAAVVRRCFEMRLPVRVLGKGCNLLVRDEGVQGAVLRLSAPPFTEVRVEGRRVRAGAGAALSALIAEAARNGLAGMETLVGLLGSVGGSLRCNVGDRSGEIGQFVRHVEVMDWRGQVYVRQRDELRFGYHASNLDDPVLLSAEFELEPDRPEAIVKRMRKAWIVRKAAQPLTFQAAGPIFQNPGGRSAAGLIEAAGLGRLRVGGAEVSDRDANFILVHPGATARDVLDLIGQIRGRMVDRGVEFDLEITVW